MVPNTVMLLLVVAIAPCSMQNAGFSEGIQEEPSIFEEERQLQENKDDQFKQIEWAANKKEDGEINKMLRTVNERTDGNADEDINQLARTVSEDTEENTDDDIDQMLRIVNEGTAGKTDDDINQMARMVSEYTEENTDDDIDKILRTLNEGTDEKQTTNDFIEGKKRNMDDTARPVEETRNTEKRYDDSDSQDNGKRVLTLPNIKLNGIVLNLNSPDLKIQVNNHLYGDTLEKREEVWAEMIKLNKMIAQENHLPIKNIEELGDISGIFEEDIVLDKEDVKELITDFKADPDLMKLESTISTTKKRETKEEKRKIKDSAKWSMPIRFKIKDTNRAAVLEAIDVWKTETCIEFKEVTGLTFGPHIVFKSNKPGCWSKVGRKLFGQTINLGTGCQTAPVIIHEIGHAIGFWHEQSRPDRNSYVNIHLNNVEIGKEHNFLRYPSSKSYNVPYDYSSIMHYRETAFAKAAGLKTITAKQPDYGRTLGQRLGMSFFDAKIANYHYCQNKCTGGLNWSMCKNGGYRNPKKCSECKCQDGWTGRYCKRRGPSSILKCGYPTRFAQSYYKYLTSPGYKLDNYPPTAECSWKIQAGP